MSVEGRTINLTLTPEGRAVTQGTVDRTLGSVGMVEYQILQTASSSYHLHFVAEEAAMQRVANEACDALRTVYGPAAVITTDAVEAIAPTRRGNTVCPRSWSLSIPTSCSTTSLHPADSEGEDGWTKLRDPRLFISWQAEKVRSARAGIRC